jgi:hypothetical protein
VCQAGVSIASCRFSPAGSPSRNAIVGERVEPGAGPRGPGRFPSKGSRIRSDPWACLTWIRKKTM